MHVALRPLYRDGVIVDVGQPVSVDDPRDREILINQGSIGLPKVSAKVEPIPLNKVNPPVKTKSE